MDGCELSTLLRYLTVICKWTVVQLLCPNCGKLNIHTLEDLNINPLFQLTAINEWVIFRTENLSHQKLSWVTWLCPPAIFNRLQCLWLEWRTDVLPYPSGWLSYNQMAILHLPGERLCDHRAESDYPLKIINAKFLRTSEMVGKMLPLQNYELLINQALRLPHLWYSCK